MIFAEQHIELCNESLTFNSLRAVYWARLKTLIISDLHVGKSAHFRKHGIAVSSNVQKKDLNRLSFLLDLYKIEHLIIVGDLFHAEINTDMNAFKSWRNSHSNVKFSLIRGNHDRLKTTSYDSYQIECYNSSLRISPYTFVHEPNFDTDQFSISGHIHPGIAIKSKLGSRIKLPCFQVFTSQLILPAFSEFTGLDVRKPNGDTVTYAFTEQAFYKF